MSQEMQQKHTVHVTRNASKKDVTSLEKKAPNEKF